MGDVYYPPSHPSFPFSSYPAQLSAPSNPHSTRPSPPNAYLAALHSQLRETGQVNEDLVKQHASSMDLNGNHLGGGGGGGTQEGGAGEEGGGHSMMGSGEAWRRHQLQQQHDAHAGSSSYHHFHQENGGSSRHSPEVRSPGPGGPHLDSASGRSQEGHALGGLKRGRKAKDSRSHSPEC